MGKHQFGGVIQDRGSPGGGARISGKTRAEIRRAMSANDAARFRCASVIAPREDAIVN